MGVGWGACVYVCVCGLGGGGGGGGHKKCKRETTK